MARAKAVYLYVGTRKGAFVFRSDLRRRKWTLENPLFRGWEVNHFMRDQRTGWLWAGMNTSWWGNDLQVSTDNGRRWQKRMDGLGFLPERKLNLNRIWRIVPDRLSRPETLWCGVDPGALFRTDNGGRNWHEVSGLNEHPTRSRWQPGGGGLMVHAILPDPGMPNRVMVGISAAGAFRSDDDGRTWRPRNQGVRADFLPQKMPDVGQCVHSMVASPLNPSWLFQQNHCGVYRSRDGGDSWDDISRGLPARFGFAMARHPHESETLLVAPEIGPECRYVCDGRLGVWRSRNGGANWKLLTRGLPQHHVYTQVLRHGMANDTCDQAGFYMGTTGGEIYYSRNGGDAWELMAAHLPQVLSLETSVH